MCQQKSPEKNRENKKIFTEFTELSDAFHRHKSKRRAKTNKTSKNQQAYLSDRLFSRENGLSEQEKNTRKDRKEDADSDRKIVEKFLWTSSFELPCILAPTSHDRNA
jgi:hypothetical protein